MHKLHGGRNIPCRNNVSSLSPLFIHKNRFDVILYLFCRISRPYFFSSQFFLIFFSFSLFYFSSNDQQSRKHRVFHSECVGFKNFLAFFFLDHGKYGFLRDWAYDENDILSVFSSKQMHAPSSFLSRV